MYYCGWSRMLTEMSVLPRRHSSTACRSAIKWKACLICARLRRPSTPLLPPYLRPVQVGGIDELARAREPALADALVEVEVELALDHGECVGIGFGERAFGHGKGAIATVLRQILLRVGG